MQYENLTDVPPNHVFSACTVPKCIKAPSGPRNCISSACARISDSRPDHEVFGRLPGLFGGVSYRQATEEQHGVQTWRHHRLELNDNMIADHETCSCHFCMMGCSAQHAARNTTRSFIVGMCLSSDDYFCGDSSFHGELSELDRKGMTKRGLMVSMPEQLLLSRRLPRNTASICRGIS